MVALDTLPDVPAPDFDAPVVYLPVRHHSPACAWHVDKVIRELRPARVLIEGPRDATSIIPFLQHADLRAPVAIFTSFVDRRGEGLPHRHGAYYPLCDYSPELVALRAARDIGAHARFIDVTYPEMVVAEASKPAAHARSLLDESHLQHSALLSAAARKIGARDHDDLWDCLYEQDFRTRDSPLFFRNVLAYCALARIDYTPERLDQEGHTAREAVMAAEIGVGDGRAVVVTGGFHTVALPKTTPGRPPAVRLSRPEDAGVTLMRYNFEQLDRLNGYASGVPSPAFYQQLWEQRDPGELIVALARRVRDAYGGASTADAVAALDHVRRLASLRGHAVPTREDVLDGVRSLYVKGSLDIEGVAVLAVARQYLAGDRVGDIPAGAGRPPLVEDFEASATAHRIAFREARSREATLDLYRSAAHRASSRFFRRLALLDVPFAALVRGPDFVSGMDLERIQEVWRYEWQPSVESRLIEMSRYGATLEEAATAYLLERFHEAEQAGNRSDVAAQLLVEACRSGLHRHTADLLQRTSALVSQDPLFVSCAGACAQLLLLRMSREPLEAHHLAGLDDAADQAWHRAARLLDTLAAVDESAEKAALDALCLWRAAADTLGDTAERRELRREHLLGLADRRDANAVLAGGACGLLYGDGSMDGDELGRRLIGHLTGTRQPPTDGARFLRGVLRAARSVCWETPQVVDGLTATLRALSEEDFVTLLPNLRLAFSDLTPRECDATARLVESRIGQRVPTRAVSGPVTEAAMLRAVRIDARVRDTLRRDGLEDYAE